MSTPSQQLKDKIEEWLSLDKNQETLNEIKSLINQNNYELLSNLLLKRMEFGTAGLRAQMGAGFSRMNDLTIIQTTQGFVKYCEEQFGDELSKKGLVIGFDSRYNSKKWASLVANIFINNGHHVYYFRDFTPTPYVPFYVRKFNAACGIMITASHNPKEDNGYKVYWSNGCQIIPPHDLGISKSIEKNLIPWEKSFETEIFKDHPLLIEVLDKVHEAYYLELQNNLHFNKDIDFKSKTPLVYTAMHGVGWKYVQDVFKKFNFNLVYPVLEQCDPDPDFPTVKFPNPEEGKSALKLAMEKAEKVNSSLIFANDPDADRLAIAEKCPVNKKWKIFTGNELAALLGWWILFNCKEEDKSKLNLISSSVSSKILQKMALKHGLAFHETLTGFKWMGNLAFDLEKEGRTCIFAFEEAIGFMCGNSVLDKDGVSALLVGADLATHVWSQGSNLNQKLSEIYNEYGICLNNNGYLISRDPAATLRMFDRLQHWNNDYSSLNYPKKCGNLAITHVCDLNQGYDSEFSDKKPRLPVSKSSQMLRFKFENDTVITIRTSGTEPKIKWYSEKIIDPQSCSKVEKARLELDQLIESVIDEFYQPKLNNFSR